MNKLPYSLLLRALRRTILKEKYYRRGNNRRDAEGDDQLLVNHTIKSITTRQGMMSKTERTPQRGVLSLLFSSEALFRPEDVRYNPPTETEITNED